jgi:hypothetical protein
MYCHLLYVLFLVFVSSVFAGEYDTEKLNSGWQYQVSAGGGAHRHVDLRGAGKSVFD